MDIELDRPFGTTQIFRHLPDGKPLHIKEDDRHPLFGRKRGDVPVDKVHQLLPHQGTPRIFRNGGFEDKILRLDLNGFLQGDMDVATHANAVSVALIHNNAVEPVGETFRLPERPYVAENTDDTFLKDLLGVVMVSHEGKYPAEEVLLKAVVKDLKGALVATLASLDDLRIDIQWGQFPPSRPGSLKI